MTNSGGEPIEIDAIGAEQSWQEWVLMNLALVPFVWKLLGGVIVGSMLSAAFLGPDAAGIIMICGLILCVLVAAYKRAMAPPKIPPDTVSHRVYPRWRACLSGNRLHLGWTSRDFERVCCKSLLQFQHSYELAGDCGPCMWVCFCAACHCVRPHFSGPNSADRRARAWTCSAGPGAGLLLGHCRCCRADEHDVAPVIIL